LLFELLDAPRAGKLRAQCDKINDMLDEKRRVSFGTLCSGLDGVSDIYQELLQST
jgi:hypothetical protein